MAKKSKDFIPTVNNVSNRDIIQRLNFLYQASAYLTNISPVSPPPRTIQASDSRKEKHSKRRLNRHPASSSDLARDYVKSLKIIGQKTNVRMYVSSICFLNMLILLNSSDQTNGHNWLCDIQ